MCVTPVEKMSISDVVAGAIAMTRQLVAVPVPSFNKTKQPGKKRNQKKAGGAVLKDKGKAKAKAKATAKANTKANPNAKAKATAKANTKATGGEFRTTERKRFSSTAYKLGASTAKASGAGPDECKADGEVAYKQACEDFDAEDIE